MISTLTCLSAFVATMQFGLASRYGDPGDRYAGRTLTCHRFMEPRSFRAAIAQGCAHRWLPCGTRLLVGNTRTGRIGACTVVDRGPYGAMHRGRWVIKRRARDPGTWRGVLDLLPPVASRLGLNGLEPVLVQPVRPRAARVQ